MGKNRAALWLSTLLAGVGIGACVTAGTASREEGSGGAGSGMMLDKPARAATEYAAGKEPIVAAVRLAAPAVVSIDTTTKETLRVFDNENDYFLGRGGRNVVREVPTGAGSGVLLEGGYVLTNQHVVSDAVGSGGSIRLTLADGRQLTATAVGADRATDIALLKVSGGAAGDKKVPVAPLGDTDTLMPGQTVIAIGNPVGLSASVSAGVVSALGRPLTLEDRTYENLIQTDTAINPGNSGGALIDLGGNVVGINTLVRTDAQNIGFAIPIKTALRIADELKANGRIRRPATGIVPIDLSPLLRRRLGIDEEIKGVVVRAVYRDSPAAGAGIAMGDIVTAIEGKAVANEAEYRRVVSSLKIGQEVRMEIMRRTEDGLQEANLRLRLAEAP